MIGDLQPRCHRFIDTCVVLFAKWDILLLWEIPEIWLRIKMERLTWAVCPTRLLIVKIYTIWCDTGPEEVWNACGISNNGFAWHLHTLYSLSMLSASQYSISGIYLTSKHPNKGGKSDMIRFDMSKAFHHVNVCIFQTAVRKAERDFMCVLTAQSAA